MCPVPTTRAHALLNPLLATFRRVAASGSFNRAAPELFLTATAVRKQMNLLEELLGLALFERGKHGCRLTGEGRALLEELDGLEALAREILVRARGRSRAPAGLLRVGTSFLNPASVFIDLLREMDALAAHPLRLIQFDDGRDGILSEIAKLGSAYDFLVAACDSRAWLQRCNFRRLGDYAVCCAVPAGHRLAARAVLQPRDLAGETVVLGERGDSSAVDAARGLLEREGGVRLENGPSFYDLEIFNACAQQGKILLTLECWRNVHPAFVTIPVEWDCRVPYGLLYAKDPPARVLAFLESLGRSG